MTHDEILFRLNHQALGNLRKPDSIVCLDDEPVFTDLPIQLEQYEEGFMAGMLSTEDMRGDE